MERIKNLISPRTRRKKLELGAGDLSDSNGHQSVPRTFGVPLSELMSRGPPFCSVPPAVTRICRYIYKYGLEQVGLFRVSGSVKLVEKMRMQLDLTGDVNLEEENDIAATAGLLKVFLRDLPDTLIPARMTQKFFSVCKNTNKESAEKDLKKALSFLPEENYQLLRYISSLLSIVASKESQNKMSPYALAILFGPNVFKCELSSNMEGLRDMDSSKELMEMLITHYNSLFLQEGEPTPQQFWENEVSSPQKSPPPPRPPPPKLSSPTALSSSPSSTPSLDLSLSSLTTTNMSSSSIYPTSDFRPIPSPRKIKNIHDNPVHTESPSSIPSYTSVPLFSPREDLDTFRTQSPFALESEAHSISESPMITARTNEFVEKTITETITEHIFGGLDFNQNSGVSGSPTSLNKDCSDCYNPGSSVDSPSHTPSQSACTSSKQPTPLPRKDLQSENDKLNENEISLEEFDSLPRCEVLTPTKKPLGPPRRTPSQKHRRSWEENGVNTPSTYTGLSEMGLDTTDVFQNESQSNKSLNNSRTDEEEETPRPYIILCDDIDSSPTRKVRPTEPEFSDGQSSPSIQILSSAGGSTSENQSPSTGIKLIIPPLDFSTLHEHIDGVEPIPASKDQTDSQLWMKKNLSTPDDENVPIVSPRSNKLKKRNGVPQNTDIPPSPPVHQDLYKTRSDDECSHKLRQLTKKIQGYKKKIKSFEEQFEREHGYKPSQGEKAAQAEIKKYLTELSKARKELKRLKDDTEKGNRSRHNSGASTSGVESSPPMTPTVESTLDFIQKCLNEKRQELNRPEDILVMSREQIQEEKLAIQRALLHFEGIHGRPSSKEDKDMMRPLYDRYRAVKRILAKPHSPRNSLELQTVPEDQMIEIDANFLVPRNIIHVPTADVDDDGITDQHFLVTKDLSVLKDINLSQREENRVIDTGWSNTSTDTDNSGDAHLHQMSLSELHIEIEHSRSNKKKLRKILREFENDFYERSGRKVLKEDRYPLQNEYNEYKKVKARLRLMEALVLKHQE